MTLAQWLERPDALQREGHRFDSDMLHKATSEEVAFLVFRPFHFSNSFIPYARFVKNSLL